MSPKRPPLTSSRLRTPGQLLRPGGAAPQAETPAASAPPLPETVQDSVPDKPGKKRPLKQRAKQMIAYINPGAHKQLKQLALQKDVQMNDLAVDAFNLLFQKEGLPQNAKPEED